MTRLIAIFLVPFLVLATLASNAAADDCTAEKRAPLKSIEASAGTWGNLRNNPGSLRYESSALIETALKNLASMTPPADLCPASCGPMKAGISFTSVPKKFLTEYDEKQKCAKLESETKKQPILYPALSFDSHDTFNGWYSDFSQGKGKEGSDLYARCDGSCSPQFTTVLIPDGKKLNADASVVCGPARDKDDNMYVLKVEYLWKCEPVK